MVAYNCPKPFNYAVIHGSPATDATSCTSNKSSTHLACVALPVRDCCEPVGLGGTVSSPACGEQQQQQQQRHSEDTVIGLSWHALRLWEVMGAGSSALAHAHHPNAGMSRLPPMLWSASLWYYPATADAV
jgi:hypothetical protein